MSRPTEALLDLARNMGEANAAFRDLEDQAGDHAATIVRTGGRWRYRHPSGGEVLFTSSRSPLYLRGLDADTVVLGTGVLPGAVMRQTLDDLEAAGATISTSEALC